jgi:hypothetical protein
VQPRRGKQSETITHLQLRQQQVGSVDAAASTPQKYHGNFYNNRSCVSAAAVHHVYRRPRPHPRSPDCVPIQELYCNSSPLGKRDRRPPELYRPPPPGVGLYKLKSVDT